MEQVSNTTFRDTVVLEQFDKDGRLVDRRETHNVVFGHCATHTGEGTHSHRHAHSRGLALKDGGIDD